MPSHNNFFIKYATLTIIHNCMPACIVLLYTSWKQIHNSWICCSLHSNLATFLKAQVIKLCCNLCHQLVHWFLTLSQEQMEFVWTEHSRTCWGLTCVVKSSDSNNGWIEPVVKNHFGDQDTIGKYYYCLLLQWSMLLDNCCDEIQLNHAFWPCSADTGCISCWTTQVYDPV